MIKRPLDRRFRNKIEDLVKETTIRDKPWPQGVPIMLYHWTGLPYRSKQENFLAVVVDEARPIHITRTVLGMGYWEHGTDDFIEGLWKTEGFESQAEMDDWFRRLVKPGEVATKWLMRFRLAGEVGG
jgi:hypothetical protein